MRRANDIRKVVIPMPTQRTGARLPTKDEQRDIQQELGLGSIDDDDLPQASSGGRRTGSSRKPWKDAGNDSKKQEFSGALIQKLRDAVHLLYENLKPRKQGPVLPMQSLQGAADAAKQVVDEAFGDWRAQAALPPANRQGPTSPDGRIALLDATDEKVRDTKDTIVSARRMAMYLAVQDKWTIELMEEHNFDPNYASSTPEERSFFKDVMKRFIELDARLLHECDRLGYNLARPGSGKIFVTPFAEGWDGKDETAGPAMQKKYDVFKHVIHEYIHLLEHPLISPISSQNITICEGLCEWLTCQVIKSLGLDKKSRGSQEYLEKEKRLRGIVNTVERADILVKYPGRAQALGEYLYGYQPAPNYAGFVNSVQSVAHICGENGLKAAYFQGHLEFLGCSWDKSWLAGAEIASDGTRSIPAPTDVTFAKVDELARATRLPPALLLKYNPDLGQPGSAGPKQFFLPGYHGHLAIVVGPDEMTETWDQISAQHGVSVARLREANLCKPDVGVSKKSWLFVPDEEG